MIFNFAKNAYGERALVAFLLYMSMVFPLLADENEHNIFNISEMEHSLALENRMAYIEEIELSQAMHPESHALFLANNPELNNGPDYNKKLFVDGGSFVVVSPRVEAQIAQDVLNSTLLAQLAADHLFDKQKQLEQ